MFALDYRRLPRLSSWQDCHSHFERKLKKLSPRRRNGTWDDSTLPLVEWRDKHLRIERYQPVGEPGYALCYHNIAVIVYYDDGRVAFNASWNSSSTRGFFGMLAPGRWDIVGSRLPSTVKERSSRTAWGYFNGQEWHSVERTGMLVLDANGTVTNPQPFVYAKKLADLQARRRIRERLKDFITWFHALSRCGDSLAAVALDDALMCEVLRAGGDASFNRCRAAVSELWKMPDDETVRRTAVSWALAYINSPSWFLIAQHADKYGMKHAPAVLRHILGELWEDHGGWRMEHVVVPAGERP